MEEDSNPDMTKAQRLEDEEVLKVCCFDGRCQNQGCSFAIRAPPLLFDVLVIWKGDGKRLKYIHMITYNFEK